jgi:hypothetical protein
MYEASKTKRMVHEAMGPTVSTWLADAYINSTINGTSTRSSKTTITKTIKNINTNRPSQVVCPGAILVMNTSKDTTSLDIYSRTNTNTQMEKKGMEDFKNISIKNVVVLRDLAASPHFIDDIVSMLHINENASDMTLHIVVPYVLIVLQHARGLPPRTAFRIRVEGSGAGVRGLLAIPGSRDVI